MSDTPAGGGSLEEILLDRPWVPTAAGTNPLASLELFVKWSRAYIYDAEMSKNKKPPKGGGGASPPDSALEIEMDTMSRNDVHRSVEGRGIEHSADAMAKTAVLPKSGANSGAFSVSADNLADSDTKSRPVANPAPGSVTDPLLTRFLDAWDRLSGADRLRLVDRVERLADST